MMTDIYYSTDEELFNDSELYEAAERVFDHEGVKIGDVAIVYSGEAIKYNASDFVRDILEDMNERAYDEAGEFASDYPDCNAEQGKELKTAIDYVVDTWANKHKLHPTFWGIKNKKEIKLKFLGGDDNFYEVVS